MYRRPGALALPVTKKPLPFTEQGLVSTPGKAEYGTRVEVSTVLSAPTRTITRSYAK
jgi:hypothetical protein